jgi:hypothetical protein
MQGSTAFLLDHFIGPREHHRRHMQAEGTLRPSDKKETPNKRPQTLRPNVS